MGESSSLACWRRSRTAPANDSSAATTATVGAKSETLCIEIPLGYDTPSVQSNQDRTPLRSQIPRCPCSALDVLTFGLNHRRFGKLAK
jgi:hypothetical protein